MRSKKLLLVNLVLIGGFLLAAYYYWFPAIWRCQTVRFADFTALPGGVRVSNDATAYERTALLQAVERSRQRIRNFWGKQLGDSSIIFCHDARCYADYALQDEGAGTSLGTPTGSWIVLGPEGLNDDVISHEMCHDELFTRLGWFKTKNSVPQWFDEGLALMVDYRFTNPDSSRRHLEYLDEWMLMTHHGSMAPDLTDLRTVKGFFGGDRQHVNRAYLTAGLEVSRWLSVVGRNGLHELVLALRRGESFDAAYARIEKSRQELTMR
jgi:hypothetical protein